MLIRKHPHTRRVMTTVVAAAPNSLTCEDDVVRVSLRGDTHLFHVEATLDELERIVEFARAVSRPPESTPNEFVMAPVIETPSKPADATGGILKETGEPFRSHCGAEPRCESNVRSFDDIANAARSVT